MGLPCLWSIRQLPCWGLTHVLRMLFFPFTAASCSASLWDWATQPGSVCVRRRRVFWNSFVRTLHLMNFQFLYHCYTRPEPGLRLFLFLYSSTAWCSCMKIPKSHNCGQRSHGELQWHSPCEQQSTVKLHHSMISVGFLLKLTNIYLISDFTLALAFSFESTLTLTSAWHTQHCI